jgi:nucleoside phosphorylase
MQSLTVPMFTVKDLQPTSGAHGWFSDNSPLALAGRCLLDALEYLRDLKSPGPFASVAMAHTVRLLSLYLPKIRPERSARIQEQLDEALRGILRSRNRAVPFYGEDYWDWAAILECFLTVHQNDPGSKIITAELVKDEMTSFREAVKNNLKSGLYTGAEGEWYGPAMAVIAHRVLQKWAVISSHGAGNTLEKLKSLALEKISKAGKYHGQKVKSDLRLWHYGQVVSEFSSDSKEQRNEIKRVKEIRGIVDPAVRVYNLARIIQGATEAKDNKTKDAAIKLLYEDQDINIRFGQGLVGYRVKGSLNALEAIWPVLQEQEKARLGTMIDALDEAHSKANMVGVLVAIESEFIAAKQAFLDDGAKIEDEDKTKFVMHNSGYRAIVRLGKSNVATSDTTHKLINEDKAQWLLMVGIAGSLGESNKKNQNSQSSRQAESPDLGPDLGGVVLATSLAPYKIRDKVRAIEKCPEPTHSGVQEESKNAPVPFRSVEWTVIPTHPGLFANALKAARELFPRGGKVTVHEGIIVTGTGIMDAPLGKAELLKVLPGGLAVEEEGYVFALLCLNEGRPYMVIRGISDLAGGDKKKTGVDDNEEARKKTAAENAAKVAVATIRKLSSQW